MKRLSYKFFLRELSSGRGVIYIRLTINRKTKFYSIGIWGTKKEWNEKQQLFKKHDSRNAIIHKYKSRLDNYIFKSQAFNFPASFPEIKALLNKHGHENDFIKYISKKIQERKHEYANQTYRTYITNISKLQDFSPQITFTDITENFILRYKKYMIEERRNNKNTTNKSLSILRTFVRMAQKDKLIHNNPFENITISKKTARREFLTIDELKRLEHYYNNTQINSHKRVLRYFLFACYTGLRFSDVVNLKHENIKNNILEIKMHKTGEYVRIPLSKKAQSLISNTKTKGKIFDTISNQKTNITLKKIMKINNVNKNISFHIARHTFATTSITIGIPIEVIQRLLGHTNIKETLIYAKVVDTLKQKEMEKWDNL